MSNIIVSDPIEVKLEPMFEYPSNKRKALCRKCGLRLEPGEGVGIEITGMLSGRQGLGTFTAYYCSVDGAVMLKLRRDLPYIEAALGDIRRWVGERFEGAIQEPVTGWVSLSSPASAAYSRLHNLVMGCGMYRRQAAEEILYILKSPGSTSTGRSAIDMASAAALDILVEAMRRGEPLLWVSHELQRRARQEASNETF